MNYVHLGGIQILVKSTFKEGINCPIVINLSDERFINAREGNLGIVEGNLAYTKLLFTYYPKYCISLKDADFNDALSLHFQIKRKDLFKPGNHIMSIYYQALYTVTNSNYGKIYKNKGMIEIDQECSGIARIVEAEVQQAHIPDEYEIQFGKTQEIGSTSNPRLSIEYGRNSIRKTISNRYSIKTIESSNITKIKGRIFNGSEWKNQEILIQTGATANHIKDTHPIQNSNLKGNINPNKVAGDVPLAPSAQNISKVYTDMPISKSKDEEKSRENEASSSSSAKAEKIISGKPECKTNAVPSGTKVFSSFQVGKQHPKEEEYLSFTRYIYNLPEESGETYGVLGTTNRVYTKPDLKELSQLPSKLFEAVKNYAQGNGVYCRFFSISMECKDIQAYYPTLNYITIEKIKDFNVKATGVAKKLPHLNKKWIQTRRALGIKALYAILNRFYKEDCRVIEQDHDWVLITKGRSKSPELKDRILDIELHRLGATEETWKLACKMLDHDHS
ncbi:hypothetical protein H5410_022970 [Solanum commersonii]|uniref:Uncharacterized protein n=1 Tax=Solanum commersonii TaxID=4109 RepID=A0A9J5ZFJ9_SOLCO|nr:hypothetical protein H5410_022970 [Solanum commersonii]